MSTKRAAILLAMLGYLGAGLAYLNYSGLGSSFDYLCPVCPHVTASPGYRVTFLWLIFVLGTLNAGLLVGAGCIVLLIRAAVQHLRRDHRATSL